MTETEDVDKLKKKLNQAVEVVESMRASEIGRLEANLRRLEIVQLSSIILLSIKLLWSLFDITYGSHFEQYFGPIGPPLELALACVSPFAVVGGVATPLLMSKIREKIEELKEKQIT